MGGTPTADVLLQTDTGALLHMYKNGSTDLISVALRKIIGVALNLALVPCCQARNMAALLWNKSHGVISTQWKQEVFQIKEL